jgi:hypothetical protein
LSELIDKISDESAYAKDDLKIMYKIFAKISDYFAQKSDEFSESAVENL